MYDVALSFAGEQREFVERVADLLRARGVRVFYDRYEQVDLWGKNLYDHLADVYENQAKLVLIFASADYAAKAWTNHERQSAQARALHAKGEYVLPARFDDTEIPGIPGTVGYVDLRHTTAEQLVDLIVEKLARLERHAAQTETPTEPSTGHAAEPQQAVRRGEWCHSHERAALAGLAKAGRSDFYEVCASLVEGLTADRPSSLVDAVRKSAIHTFGWPIGVYLPSVQEARARINGAVYELSIDDSNRSSYDYWAASTTGDFYLLKTLSEDALGSREHLFFNTRIVRVAETVMFLKAYYAELGAPPESQVDLSVRHLGLRHRSLSAAGNRKHTLSKFRTTDEDEASTSVRFAVGSPDDELIALVKRLLEPLFMVYEFFEVPDEVYADLISRFRAGEVS